MQWNAIIDGKHSSVNSKLRDRTILLRLNTSRLSYEQTSDSRLDGSIINDMIRHASRDDVTQLYTSITSQGLILLTIIFENESYEEHAQQIAKQNSRETLAIIRKSMNLWNGIYLLNLEPSKFRAVHDFGNERHVIFVPWELIIFLSFFCLIRISRKRDVWRKSMKRSCVIDRF